MTNGRIRRAQLIAPFGVGAMNVLVNGTSVITAGLDHWFESSDPSNLQLDEFLVPEWRLQRRLRVSQLRLPPDRRTAFRGGGAQPNVNLTVPVLRFPRWSFCPYCKRLGSGPLTLAEPLRCPDAKHATSKVQPVMAQVPFVAICGRGHLDDFPWNEWAHGSHRPSCGGPLRLKSRGGGSLSGQVITCDGCTKERSLEGVMQASNQHGHEETFLTNNLQKGEPFTCGGPRPWLADAGQGCGSPLRGALRGASNVYFPVVESSIFLPTAETTASPELLDLLRAPGLNERLRLVIELVGDVTAAAVRKADSTGLLAPFSDDELVKAVKELMGPAETPSDEDDDTAEELSPLEVWRYPEWVKLREASDHPDLVVTRANVPDGFAGEIARLNLVEQLRETRALRGFRRVRDATLPLSEGKALLRLASPQNGPEWLPAYVVRGEGIFLELHPERLAAWEARPDVVMRIERMAATFAGVQSQTGLRARPVTPRFVLLHTLAHLLINRLVFECGYSSASLRERLFASSDSATAMAGLLIYTAAGDSEGNMGGLVRMGRPQTLARVTRDALSDATWCSTDPVCMELGEAGQGPSSCNMAACHGCALLPETACEEFNRFLDRGVVVGTHDSPELGYFTVT